MGFGVFEKMKCIFSIAPMKSLEKSPECFLTEKHPRDALTVGTGRCAYVSSVLFASDSVRVKHQTLCTGYGLDPVCVSGVA